MRIGIVFIPAVQKHPEYNVSNPFRMRHEEIYCLQRLCMFPGNEPYCFRGLKCWPNARFAHFLHAKTISEFRFVAKSLEVPVGSNKSHESYKNYSKIE